VQPPLEELLGELVRSWPSYARGFPWRAPKDPWEVLLAEVLLVQTDAAKVARAWASIAGRLGDPCAALALPREELEGLLRPLGLQRQRASRILRLASALRDLYGCRVPCSYEELRALPGVGDYIASAVYILACGGRAAPLDANIARVLSRVYRGSDPPGRYSYDEGLKGLASSASWGREELLAAVDFAASICRARKPRCAECPIRGKCRYYASKQAQAAGQSPPAP